MRAVVSEQRPVPSREFRASLAQAVETLVFVALPVVAVVMVVVLAVRDGVLAYDITSGYGPFAERVWDGVSPYPGHSPPLVLFLLAPLTVLPGLGLEWLATVATIACVPASLWLLGVRDRRVYGVAFLWAPVLSGIQTANLTLPLVLAAAATWRLRDHRAGTALATGLGIAAKAISAPFAVWLAATRRWSSAILSVVVAVAVTGALLLLVELFWEGGVGGASGPGSVIDDAETPSYGVADLVTWAGGSLTLARGALVVATLALLAGCLVAARRGNERGSFALAAAATIVVAPNVWLHSLSFLLLALAVLRPRFGPVWLLPVVLLAVPVRDPSPGEAVLFWAVAALTLALALRRPRQASTGAAVATPRALAGRR